MENEDRHQGISWEDIFWEPRKYNERRKLKADLYLRSFCPHCNKELMRHDMIRLAVVNLDGESGWMELSPYLNVFDRKTDIRLPEGQEVKELCCPHCHHSLVEDGKQCGMCNSRVASFLVGVSNTKVPFLICVREGCRWHAVSPSDETQIILDDSHEW